MQSGNPTLRDGIFKPMGFVRAREVMTVDGTINKTGVALAVLLLVGGVAWNLPPRMAVSAMLGGMVVGVALALATAFKPAWASWSTLPYAVAEGLLLGSLSRFFELRYPGIAANAALLTVALLVAMLLLYRVPAVRESESLARGIIVATCGVGLLYVVGMVLRLFGRSLPFIHDSGPLGIGFSVVVVGLAAFNLVVDFQFIERGTRSGAPRHLEWYGAFSLLVTLVWLYVELLRLLSKLQDRRR